MTDRTEGASARVQARIAGFLYLLNILAGAFLYGFVRSTMIAPGQAATTSANIEAHALLYRLGFVAGLVPVLCNIPLALIFYDLFKVVNRSCSALVAFFILVASAIEGANLLNYYAPLILLEGGNLSAFKAEQLQAFAYISLALHAIGFNVAVVFFVFYDLLIGYLIFRSNFLPRILGVLMAIAGLCYMTNSLASVLSPRFATHLVPYILVPAGLGELALSLWLLVMSVDAESWREQANAA
jgi:hypothetical protein